MFLLSDPIILEHMKISVQSVISISTNYQLYLAELFHYTVTETKSFLNHGHINFDQFKALISGDQKKIKIRFNQRLMDSEGFKS